MIRSSIKALLRPNIFQTQLSCIRPNFFQQLNKNYFGTASIAQLTLKDFSDALNLSSSQFVARQPMVNITLTQEEFKKIVGNTIYECCQSGLSFGVRDETNQLIAAQLSIELVKYKIESNYSKFDPILGILKRCEQGYVPQNPAKTLAIFIVASSSKSSRKGNLKSILAHSERIWKEKGFEQVFLDATNISSINFFFEVWV